MRQGQTQAGFARRQMLDPDGGAAQFDDGDATPAAARGSEEGGYVGALAGRQGKPC
jgi:hypothetical protein